MQDNGFSGKHVPLFREKYPKQTSVFPPSGHERVFAPFVTLVSRAAVLTSCLGKGFLFGGLYKYKWPQWRCVYHSGGRSFFDFDCFSTSGLTTAFWGTMSDLVLLLLLVALLLCLLVTLGAFVLFSGLLSDVIIKTGPPPIKNVTIAYKFKEGSYKDCGASYTESCSIGPKLSSIGVFYDDPKQVRDPGTELLQWVPALFPALVYTWPRDITLNALCVLIRFQQWLTKGLTWTWSVRSHTDNMSTGHKY